MLRRLHTILHSMFPARFSTTKLAHDGCDPSDAWKVVGIGHSKVRTENLEIVDVSTIAEYDRGCQQHEKCLGHLCRSPFGMILPMQSAAVSTPTVKNDISRAANAAFAGHGQYYATQYSQILSDSMKKKTGRMRKGILNCHIDGSLRMVIGPQESLDTNVVTIPHYLRDKWTVLYFDESTNRYKSRNVSEGDRAIAVRPPSLSIRSVQPVRLCYWNETYMGISPDLLKAFDGDYDGDEMQIYPVYSKAAVQECDEWHNTPNESFIKARSIYESSGIPSKGTNKYSFMDHTTLSFQEIKLGKEQPLMAEQTRTKTEHLTGFRERYKTDEVSKSFTRESIRGMGDTNAQQLSQPIEGDRSRIAKIVASCVVQREDGTIGLATEHSFHKVCTFEHDQQDGSPCVRAISTICAGSQQATLNSHHAKKESLPEHNITTDMIQGTDQTLLLFDKRLSERQLLVALKPSWYDRTEDGIYALCKVSKSRSLPVFYLKGSYNPVVLSRVGREKRLEVCRRGIEAVARHCSFAFSPTQIVCLAALFSFRVEDSPRPITTREGVAARKLRWTEVMMSNHYSMLGTMLRDGDIPISPIETVSSCLMAGNFMDL